MLSSVSSRKTSARGGREVEAKESTVGKSTGATTDEFELPRTFVLEREILVDKRTGQVRKQNKKKKNKTKRTRRRRRKKKNKKKKKKKKEKT